MPPTEKNYLTHRDNLAILVDIFPPSLQSVLDQVVTVNRGILEQPFMAKMAQLLEAKGYLINSLADLQIAVTCLHDHPKVMLGIKAGAPAIITIIELLGGTLEDEEKKEIRKKAIESNALQRQYGKTVTRVLADEGLFDGD